MTQLFALLISLTIEVPIVLFTLLTTQQFFAYFDICNSLITAYLVTFLTHPLAWEVNNMLVPYLEFPVRATLIESCVTLAEGILYWVVLNLGWQKGLFLSLVANASSFLGGLLIAQFLT
jgi:hypothetical protein